MKLSDCTMLTEVDHWFWTSPEKVENKFRQAMMRAFELGQQSRQAEVERLQQEITYQVDQRIAARSLPVVTGGDAATDKATEASYLDNNWVPLANTRYLINDAGQLRVDRNKTPRGNVARGCRLMEHVANALEQEHAEHFMQGKRARGLVEVQND